MKIIEALSEVRFRLAARKYRHLSERSVSALADAHGMTLVSDGEGGYYILHADEEGVSYVWGLPADALGDTEHHPESLASCAWYAANFGTANDDYETPVIDPDTFGRDDPGVEITITRELVEEAERNGWSGGEMFATALQRAIAPGHPELRGIEVHVPPNADAKRPELRDGYVARPDPRDEQ